MGATEEHVGGLKTGHLNSTLSQASVSALLSLLRDNAASTASLPLSPGSASNWAHLPCSIPLEALLRDHNTPPAPPNLASRSSSAQLPRMAQTPIYQWITAGLRGETWLPSWWLHPDWRLVGSHQDRVALENILCRPKSSFGSWLHCWMNFWVKMKNVYFIFFNLNELFGQTNTFWLDYEDVCGTECPFLHIHGNTRLHFLKERIATTVDIFLKNRQRGPSSSENCVWCLVSLEKQLRSWSPTQNLSDPFS